jgi:hypothetical protein
MYNQGMADSLFDILSRKDFDEPPEITAIKEYVSEQFQEAVEVIVRERDIIVTVASAALAGTLRFQIPKLRKAAKTDKRIILRIR